MLALAYNESIRCGIARSTFQLQLHKIFFPLENSMVCFLIWKKIKNILKRISWSYYKSSSANKILWICPCSELNFLISKLISTCVSHSVISDYLWSHGLQPSRLLCPRDSPGKNTGVGCYSFLHGTFPTQWWNLSLLPCRQILYSLSHQGILRCKLI